ncbi:MAG: hypothetical protein DRO00_00715 [Thermoproteota archaeon]|nr:MAG: hypothetical protein DRO00_00715 [Candidatus Korarchaeota archaeon]
MDIHVTLITMGMSTEEIMGLALEMAGFESIPADSEIYNPKEDVNKVLFAIDVGVPGLLLAKMLGCDAAIAHHPEGGMAAIENFKVFRKHVDLMVRNGVPKKVAEEAVERKMRALMVKSHQANYDLAPSVARVLDMGYMNIHNPLDELGRKIMQEVVDKVGKDAKVGDLMLAFTKLKEFSSAKTPIMLVLGDEENKVGKAVVAHGALTNGGSDVAKAYFEYGVDTLIYIHIEPKDLEILASLELEGNLLVTGHIASDCVGINPFIRELERRGIEVIPLGLVGL